MHLKDPASRCALANRLHSGALPEGALEHTCVKGGEIISSITAHGG